MLSTLALLGVLFSWNSWKRDFWNPDEPRLAHVIRAMESGGDWILPQLAGSSYLDNPPLSYWMAALVHRSTGLDPRVSYRLPGILAAVLGLALTWLVGKRLFDGRIGYLAMVIQGSSWAWFRGASWLDDDLSFAVSVQLALGAFAIAASSKQGRIAAWAGWVGLAGCALTKSALLAFGLVFPVILFWLFFENGVDSVRLGFRRLRFGAGLLILGLLGGSWYVAAAIQDGSALLSMHFVGQHFARLMNAVDARPPYFYIGALALGFLPWTIFIPLGLLHGKDRTRRNGERLCIFWIIFMLVALSVVSGKKAGYILVVWSPLSLLIAAAFFEVREWFSLWEDFLRDGLFSVVPVILRVPFFLAVLAAGSWYAGLFDSLDDPRFSALLSDKSALFLSIAVVLAATLLIYLMARRVKRLVAEKAFPKAAFELAAASLLLYLTLAIHDGALGGIYSSRETCDRFASKWTPGAAVALYGSRHPEILYYLERPGTSLLFLEYPEEIGRGPRLQRIEEFLRRPEPAFIVTTESELQRLRTQFPSLVPFLHEKDRGAIGMNLRLVLAGNKP